jgi:hypothetical protein
MNDRIEEIKELSRSRKRINALESNLNAKFRKFSKKCEHRKLIIPEELDCVEWSSCTNKEHPYRGATSVVCKSSLCPLLR